MRRIILILLTLVLAPSVATASWYRCAYDGTIRSVCCCPTKPDQHKKNAPPPDTSLRAACCCTVIQATSNAREIEASTPAQSKLAPMALAVPTVVAPRPAPILAVALDRPRAQGDPPDTLFTRRCLLLL
ncbi:MAG TPA: hypothetical protein VF516_21560 [Kofleriaceae bacterium]